MMKGRIGRWRDGLRVLEFHVSWGWWEAGWVGRRVFEGGPDADTDEEKDLVMTVNSC